MGFMKKGIHNYYICDVWYRAVIPIPGNVRTTFIPYSSRMIAVLVWGE